MQFFIVIRVRFKFFGMARAHLSRSSPDRFRSLLPDFAPALRTDGPCSSRQSPPRVLSPRGVCTRDARCLARGFSHIGFLAPSHSALTFRLRRRSPRRPFRPLLPTSGAFRLYSQSPLSPACHIALVGPSPARKSGKPRIEPVFSLLKPRPAVFL